MYMKNTIKVLLFCTSSFIAAQALAVVYQTADSTFGDIGKLIGANAFYERGIYGQGANVANIELYAAWRDDEDWNNCMQYLEGASYNLYKPETTSQAYAEHSYQTLGIMAGYNPNFENQAMSTGLAYKASYTSAQIAEDSFFRSDKTELETYKLFFTNSTDVISSSWCDIEIPLTYKKGVVLDSYAYANPRTLLVGAAANDGAEGANTVRSPFLNMNALKVGALDDSTNFKTVASYSSYGPNHFYNPVTKEVKESVVSAVDIVAPGTVYTVTESKGTMNIQGTSFAAPIVSSVAALMHSYSVDKKMRADSRDARLIKAVLMNSADKIAGWDNGSKRETVRVGDVDYANVLSTKQALDFKSGAGALNAEAALQAYDQFGTTSFLESVEFENSSYFDFHTDLTQFEFSATLCWYIGTVVDNVTYTETTIAMSTIHQINEVSADNSYFANLDLRLWQFDGESYVLLAESVSEYNNVEHIFMELSEAGDYRLEVAFSEMLYGTTPNETFALAYNLAQIPESSDCAAIFGALALWFAVYYRRR